jgi:EpsI family protein
MTTKLAIFCAVMLAAFSMVFALPRQLGYQPVGIVMRLPESIGLWLGKAAAVTEQEQNVLGADTGFERKNYYNGTGDHLFASIVLAGQDMMTGIHRPERCLLAQGWTTGSASQETIGVPGFGPMKVTRLQTSKKVEIKAPAGQPPRFVTVRSVSYYWFVGYTDTAASHEQRVALDFRDRIFHGYNQRWAMVMLTSEITEGLQRFGRDEKQTDELLQGFIKDVTPKILGESVRRHAAASAPAQVVAIAQ